MLADGQRFNHFPASPLCAITWFFDGKSEVLQAASSPGVAPARIPLERFVVSGVRTRPTTSWNPGGVRALMVILYPDALRPLLAVSLRNLIDRTLPAREVLAPDWIQRLEVLFDAAPDVLTAPGRCFDHVQQRLAEAWPGPEAVAFGGGVRLEDWLLALTIRAAGSRLGRGVRQLQRRFTDWTGLSRRELEAFAQAERLFLLTMNQKQDIDAVRLAADAGYADQSHMIRRVRRVTGLPPRQLLDRIQHDEAYWVYRVLGTR
jgi:AraC-like DNA-binding protein